MDHSQTYGGGCAGNPCLEFFALFSAVVGRRPYFDETEGAIIVSTDSSLAGVPGLTVSAALNVGGASALLLSRVPLRGGAKVKMPFSLSKIPTTITTTLTITLVSPLAPSDRETSFGSVSSGS